MTISKLAALAWAVAIFVFGGVFGAFINGVFSGAGLDPDKIGREVGALLVSPIGMETASIGKAPATPVENEAQRQERERIKQEVALAKTAAKKAAKAYDDCVAYAKDSLLKMWDPDFHCAEQKVLKLAAEARYDAWK